MYNQPRYESQADSKFFADRRMMRMPVAQTVPREQVLAPEFAEGIKSDESGYIDVVPAHVIESFGQLEKTLTRGRERFNIYCAPCHSRTGDGQGMVVQRGMLKPPSFLEERLLHAPDGQIFATITNGVRNMPSYSAQIPIVDHWSIVAYLRVLQENLVAKGSKVATAGQ